MVDESIHTAKSFNLLLSYLGATAFYLACEKKHADVMVCLMNHGADPSVTVNSGTSPFSLIDKKLFGKLFIILHDP